MSNAPPNNYPPPPGQSRSPRPPMSGAPPNFPPSGQNQSPRPPMAGSPRPPMGQPQRSPNMGGARPPMNGPRPSSPFPPQAKPGPGYSPMPPNSQPYGQAGSPPLNMRPSPYNAASPSFNHQNPVANLQHKPSSPGPQNQMPPRPMSPPLPQAPQPGPGQPGLMQRQFVPPVGGRSPVMQGAQVPSPRPPMHSPTTQQLNPQQQIQSPQLNNFVSTQPDPTAPPGSPPGNASSPGQRRRMYPDQIATAYTQGEAPQQSNYPGPASGQSDPLPGAQGSQFFVPGLQGQTSPVMGYGQPQTPGYTSGQPYGQQFNNMQNQFNNMALGGQNQLFHTPLMGTPLNPAELDLPPPAANIPPGSAVTQSPKIICDPSLKRCTFNAIPQNSNLLKKCKIPFGLIMTPYKLDKQNPDDIPISHEIIRCRRCRTYLNPFIQFVDSGRRWKCNMCFFTNDVPSTFDYDIQSQQPIDRFQRPELTHSVVEYIAPAEYMVRAPQPPVYLFLIDVSHTAVQSGMVATAARTILESLDRIPDEEKRAKVGFITYDSALHFYNLNNELSEPQMLVVSDLEDPFIPMPNDLLVNLGEGRHIVESLLSRLGEMFKSTHNVSSALAPALQAGLKLISSIGGKIIVLQNTLPTAKEGALTVREDVKLLGTPKESSLLQPASQFYKPFAVDCSRAQVCVDTFLFGTQYIDVATLSGTSRFSAGQTYFYPGFNAGKSEDAVKFANEFSEFLSCPAGLEAVLRVRASKGLRMTAYHGNFFLRSMDLLALPNVTPNHTYSVEVTIDEPIETSIVCFQTALLHTSCNGERRIRVLTLGLPVANNISEVFKSADQVAIVTLLARKAVERSLSTKLEDARDALINKCIDILGIYKTELTSVGTGASPQLQICHNLKMLPLLVQSLIKHVSLRGGSQTPSDVRSFAMNLVNTMPAELLMRYIHPRFYALHNMAPEIAVPTTDDSAILMPQPLPLSSERLERNGLFLLESGQHIFFWVAKEVSPQLCQELFDVPSYDAIRPGRTTLPILDTDFSSRVQLIISKIREANRYIYYPQVYVVKEESDPSLRLWFLSHLIEDRANNVMSYQQFLNHLKDKVNTGNFK
ncbi:COPII subunit [Basidiobolus ranarum]|uniref:COPII subunit n=1 Tax=Basidiobolus ranarum TaxID=34480 RepID=A0ABR2W068_9FUNG